MSKKGKRDKKDKMQTDQTRDEKGRPALRRILTGAAVAGILIVLVVVLKAKTFQGGEAANRPTKGRSDAKVTIVEFGDFQCPACKRAQEPLAQVLAKFPRDVRLEFHNFPLITVHVLSLKAAEAADCAFDQGKFWEMHDLLYKNQEIWPGSSEPLALFGKYAGEIGLDRKRFDACVGSDMKHDAVMADLQMGEARRINSTPTFFINGTRVVGIPSAEYLIEVVTDALKKAGG